MKKLLLILVVFTLTLLTGCTTPEENNESTLTCEFGDSEAVYTYTEDEIISVVIDGEEVQTADYWNDVINNTYEDVDEYITEMHDWYTNDAIFTDSTCNYN